MSTSTELEEMLKRMGHLPGVQGIIVINTETGLAIRSSFNQEKTNRYLGVMHPFLVKAKSVIRELDQSNEITFIRVRSRDDEIMFAPEKEYTMIVVQKPKFF